MTDAPEPPPPGAVAPPVTGHHEIDRALASLRLDADVTTHPAALAGALDAVARALAGPSVPQGLRPRP